MAFTKLFIVFAATIGVVSSIDAFAFFTMVPYTLAVGIDRVWIYCPANSTNEISYKKVLNEASECVHSFPKNQSLCYNVRNNAARCFQPIADYFNDCLPEHSKDLMPAIVKTFESLADAFCTSSGEILLELVKPCMDIYLQEKTIKKECKVNFLLRNFKKYQKELPSKSEACNAFRQVGDCWQEDVNLNCKNSKTREFFSKFYNAALVACK